MSQNPHAANERVYDDGNWWTRPCGGRDVLIIALPMMISTSFASLMHFIDRMFLTWKDTAAMSASLQAGFAQWVCISFAIGIVSYTNAFVSQYHGAKHDERVGVSVWQGIWVGVFLTPFFLLAIPFAPVLFALVGHAPEAQALEAEYFATMAWGSGPCIIACAMSAFFTGRGLTWVTMVVSGIAAVVNCIGDWILIFDRLGLGISPIAGAAWATVFAHWTTVLVYALWMYLPRTHAKFNLTRWKPDWPLLGRLVRFGGASGLHMFIEGAGFTVLVMIVGGIDKVAAEATALAFNVNIVLFIPIVGLGIAISTMVGHEIGRQRPDLAERATWTGLTMGLGLSSIAAFIYFVFPGVFLYAYEVHADPAQFDAIRGTTVILLRFVALYFLFDTMQIVFACAIKGAGDTFFVLVTAATISFTCIVVGQIGATYFDGGLYWWWSVMTAWLFALAMVYLARFLQGGWRKMHVIENKYVAHAEPEPEVAEVAG